MTTSSVENVVSPWVRAGLLALVLGAILGTASPACAQQNPIITATQAPPLASRYGYGSGYSPYGPYGSAQPYQSYNPSTQSLANPQTGQPTQPGQTQTPATQQALQAATQGGSGNGGGSNSGGGSNNGGQAGDGGANGNGNAAQGASYEILQNPGSPLYKRYERSDAATTQLRPQVLTQIGRGKGIRRGFVEEARRIAASIDPAAMTRLDAHYDFSKQMIGEHLVPPVIGEARSIQEKSGDRLLYLTVGSYQIVRPARLVLTPPNWRDYLFIEVADTQTSISALSPTNADEQSIFDQAFDGGLAKGIQEARDTFEDNLNRLDRDYGGMERYHELARQGAVSLPVVNDSRRAVRVAENGTRAFVGEQVVTLRITPRFKATRQAAFK